MNPEKIKEVLENAMHEWAHTPESGDLQSFQANKIHEEMQKDVANTSQEKTIMIDITDEEFYDHLTGFLKNWNVTYSLSQPSTNFGAAGTTSVKSECGDAGELKTEVSEVGSSLLPKDAGNKVVGLQVPNDYSIINHKEPAPERAYKTTFCNYYNVGTKMHSMCKNRRNRCGCSCHKEVHE